LTILVLSMGLTAVYVRFTEPKEEKKELRVVTSFYPMYIAAMNVTKDIEDVKLENLSEPQTGCLHDFQLTPEDMKLLSTADVFIINGGGIESFMKEAASACPDLIIIEAGEYVELLSDGEEVNAHAWLSVPCYRDMVQAIAAGLSDADSAHADLYRQNAAVYDDKLSVLEKELKEAAQQLSGRNVVIFHEAFEYIAEDYGMQVSCVLDLDEERAVSAGEISDVLDAVRNEHADLILAEELYGKSTASAVQKETDAAVIYLNPLNRGEYDCDSYLKGMEENITLLRECANA
ncbi:MAG: metal ABC transporter substrate-binding protein, partial [Butyrivibrio sp.]|nr:metal ABC transporter substrate-binding protein [Butyrivibrio sp.]